MLKPLFLLPALLLFARSPQQPAQDPHAVAVQFVSQRICPRLETVFHAGVDAGPGAPRHAGVNDHDLARPGVKLSLADPSVPVGTYSVQVLDKLAADAAYGADFFTRPASTAGAALVRTRVRASE